MPELPEVEHVRLTLAPLLATRRVQSVDLRRRDIVHGPHAAQDLLLGATGLQLDRRGKQLAISAPDGRTVVVHLGMSGQMFWVAPGASIPDQTHVHAIWSLRERAVAGGRLIFRDPRRFGGLWTYPSRDALAQDRWRLLGPDALSIDGATLRERLRGSRRALKATLLDQTVLAGIGNIYADEALFRARLSPLRPAGGLQRRQYGVLAHAIVEILEASIAAGGSSVRDYRDGLGTAGMFQQRHAVYGRAGEPCMRCGGTLRSGVVSQRTTVWCARCQRPSRSSNRSHHAKTSQVVAGSVCSR